jgi:UV DNA damage repair endonuclease
MVTHKHPLVSSTSFPDTIALYETAVRHARSKKVDFYRVSPSIYLALKRECGMTEKMLSRASESVDLLKRLSETFCALDVRTECHASYFCHIDVDDAATREMSLVEIRCMLALLKHMRTFATMTIHLHKDDATCRKVLRENFTAEERDRIGIENNHDGSTWGSERVLALCAEVGTRPIYDVCHDFLFCLRNGQSLTMGDVVNRVREYFSGWSGKIRPFIHYGVANSSNKGLSHNGEVNPEKFWRIINTLRAEIKDTKFDVMLETPNKELDVVLLRGNISRGHMPLSEELNLWA